MAFMSQADDEKIKSLKQQYAERQAAGADNGVLDAIHSQAENVRSRYGYSGGTDGSQYVPLTATTQSTTPASNGYNDYINQLYAAKNSAAVAGLTSAYNQNVSTLNNTASKIPAQYTAARNQTAGTYETNQSNMNERAAATGMNSGAGSQLALSLANNYAGNLTTLNNSEANALSDIETQKSQLATNYNTAIAQAQAENDLAKAQALYEEGVRKENQLISQQQYDAEQQTSADNTAYNKNTAMAETLAAYGDFSGYKALGYSDAQIANMKAAYLAKTTKKTTGGGSYSGSTTSADTTAPTETFNSSPAYDETSPMGIISDISGLRKQGFTNAQIKANAKAAYSAGKISGSQYQMYVQYTGAD